ncbi:MAG TPA: sulfurtransferase-like selenium metabolism protein YedF [Thermodesulfobacteriaceae bacterium]|nr:sulfurtransferase-like selenium metabolism protein YedF [Thermodesulfobacteriaceae bacterium]
MRKKDCCGIACPGPVLAVRELIETYPQDPVEIRVDNQAARVNVSRFLRSRGWMVESVQESEGVFVVTGNPGACTVEPASSWDECPGVQKILVFIPSDMVGHGDERLGRSLIKNFLVTLPEMGEDLWRVVLVNSGVKLAVENSECLEEIKKIEAQGVDVLVCGTCLEFFGLTARKAAGETTNMLDIITSMQLASKIVRV